MATLSRADVAAAMSLLLQDKSQNQFRKDLVLLNMIRKRRGRNAVLVWNPKFAGRSAGGAYAEGADMADGDFDSHIRTQASLAWSEYRKGVKVSGLAMAVTAEGYVSSMEATGDLFDEELVDAIDDLALDLAGDVYGGDPGASPVELAGVALAVDGTGGTFAGLASGTYADWIASEATIPTASLSFETIKEHLIRPVKDATGRDPTAIFCDGATWDLVEALFEEKADVVNEVMTPNGMFNLRSVGARAIVVRGVPVIEDRHCTANTLYSLTLDDIEFNQVPALGPNRDPRNIVAAIKALTGIDVSPEDVMKRMLSQGDGVITPTIEILAQTGDAYKAMVKVYGQVKWRKRNSHAKLTLT